jgi:Ca-activated chloride channel homolog
MLSSLFTYHNFTLSHPLWLLLLLLWPLYLFIKNNNKSRSKNALLLSNTGILKSIKTPWRIKLKPIVHILFLIGFIFLVMAMARPQKNNFVDTTEGNGVDIVLSMDISGSMLAQDFTPNRLDAAKKVAQNFIAARPYDRIGLVIFSGESFTLCPLTTDQNILNNQIINMRSGMLEDGTAIGMGLATAVDRLRNSSAKSKVIILLTDGVNNVGTIDPRTALDIALAFKIKVYTIGVGTKGLANMPVGKDPFGNWVFDKVPVEIDENLMTEIATKTGGQYFRCTDNNALETVYAQIDKLEKSKIDINTQKKIKELYYPFALFGFIFIVLAIMLDKLVFRSFP